MIKLTCVSLVLVAGMAFAGCNNKRMSADGSTTMPSVSVEASSTSIVVGETATFIARSRDTYGRDARIRWTSTAGKLTTEQDGRVARVRFDEVGTYTVRAILTTEGRDIQSDMIEVRVRPIN